MAEFKREERYIVIKYSDVETFWRDDVREQFMSALKRLNEHDVRTPQRKYLVIESDWPEFEPAYGMIEARMTGKPGLFAILECAQGDLRQAMQIIEKQQDLLRRTLDYYTESCFPEDLLVEVKAAIGDAS